MDYLSLVIGIVICCFALPITVVFLVSLRRSLLDGAKLNDLTAKFIFITGCDTGFGFDLAQRLDSLGCVVIASCLTEEGKQRIRDSSSSRVHAISLDVTNEGDVDAAVEKVKNILPSENALWGIVNNAGIMTFHGPLETQSLKSMRKSVEVNLWGTINITRAFLPLLKKSKGRIVNVSSMMSRTGFPGSSAYCISKGGVAIFSDSIRRELQHFGVTVHILEPGAFKTDLLNWDRIDEQLTQSWDNASKEIHDDYGKDYMDKVKHKLKQVLEMANPKKHLVVDCMEHALLSNNPKRRYFPGNDSAFGMWWLSLLPGEILDFLLKLSMVAPRRSITK